MHWYSDDSDRSIQFNFNRLKSGLNKALYGHRSSPEFLTNILKYRLDRQLTKRKTFASGPPMRKSLDNIKPTVVNVCGKQIDENASQVSIDYGLTLTPF